MFTFINSDWLYPLVVNNILFFFMAFDWNSVFPGHLWQTISCYLKPVTVINFLLTMGATLFGDNQHLVFCFPREKFIFHSVNWIFINDQTKNVIKIEYFVFVIYFRYYDNQYLYEIYCCCCCYWFLIILQFQ